MNKNNCFECKKPIERSIHKCVGCSYSMHFECSKRYQNKLMCNSCWVMFLVKMKGPGRTIDDLECACKLCGKWSKVKRSNLYICTKCIGGDKLPTKDLLRLLEFPKEKQEEEVVYIPTPVLTTDGTVRIKYDRYTVPDDVHALSYVPSYYSQSLSPT